MPSSWMLRRVALIRTDVSEERIATVISVTKIDDLGTQKTCLERLTKPCKTEFSLVWDLPEIRSWYLHNATHNT
jgi:hypothetical protein